MTRTQTNTLYPLRNPHTNEIQPLWGLWAECLGLSVIETRFGIEPQQFVFAICHNSCVGFALGLLCLHVWLWLVCYDQLLLLLLLLLAWLLWNANAHLHLATCVSDCLPVCPSVRRSSIECGAASICEWKTLAPHKIYRYSYICIDMFALLKFTTLQFVSATFLMVFHLEWGFLSANDYIFSYWIINWISLAMWSSILIISKPWTLTFSTLMIFIHSKNLFMMLSDPMEIIIIYPVINIIMVLIWYYSWT